MLGRPDQFKDTFFVESNGAAILQDGGIEDGRRGLTQRFAGHADDAGNFADASDGIANVGFFGERGLHQQ